MVSGLTQIALVPYGGYYFYNRYNLNTLKIPYEPNGTINKAVSNKDYPIDINKFLNISAEDLMDIFQRLLLELIQHQKRDLTKWIIIDPH